MYYILFAIFTPIKSPDSTNYVSSGMLKRYFLLLFAASLYTAGRAQKFQVTYPAATLSTPFTGKVILYLNKENRNPKDAMADLEVFPCFSIDAKNIKPGT